MSQEHAIRIGISSCLLGNGVRYDGGHKHDHVITDALGKVFEYVAICPEVAIGLGVPRETLRLVGDPLAPRAVGTATAGHDVTSALAAYGTQVASELGDISGYILKKGSPSCGMERVRVYDANNAPSSNGVGIFARQLMNARPLLPVEEEGRLHNPALRDAFLERVYIYNRWQQLEAEGVTVTRLTTFHAAHKYLLMTRGHQPYLALGRLVAQARKHDVGDVASEYIRSLMAAMGKPATRGRHANVLMHLMGYFKQHLQPDDKQELLQSIRAYQMGRLPLAAPITLLKHYLRRYPNAYLQAQHYFAPYPETLTNAPEHRLGWGG